MVERYLGKGHRSMGWGWGDTKVRDTESSLKTIPSLTGVGSAASRGQRGDYIAWGLPGKKEGQGGEWLKGSPSTSFLNLPAKHRTGRERGHS